MKSYEQRPKEKFNFISRSDTIYKMTFAFLCSYGSIGTIAYFSYIFFADFNITLIWGYILALVLFLGVFYFGITTYPIKFITLSDKYLKLVEYKFMKNNCTQLKIENLQKLEVTYIKKRVIKSIKIFDKVGKSYDLSKKYFSNEQIKIEELIRSIKYLNPNILIETQV